MEKLSCLLLNREPHHENSLTVAEYGIDVALTMSAILMAQNL